MPRRKRPKHGLTRAFRFRAYPCIPETDMNLGSWIYLCHVLWNVGLEQRDGLWHQRRKSISGISQSYDLPELKREFPVFASVGSQVLRNVLDRLDKAYSNFFARIKRGNVGGESGFPLYKNKHYAGSFTFPNSSGWRYGPLNEYGYPEDRKENRFIIIQNKQVVGAFRLRGGWQIVAIDRLPNLMSRITLHKKGPKARIKMTLDVLTITVKRDVRGQWFIIFACDGVPTQPLESTGKALALDLGINRYLTDSDGNVEQNPRFTEKDAAHLRVLNRQLARRKKGSRGWKETKRILSQLHERVANRRRDHHCKLALRYARENDTIIAENLSVMQMIEEADHRKLRRDISDVSWAEFRHRLRNACERHERDFVLVDPAYTTRTCNKCGYVHDRPVISMTFVCPWCGTNIDRPLNSAKNIRAKASPAERNVGHEPVRAPQIP